MESAEYLQKLKEEKGLSYFDLAERTGTSHGYWFLVIKRRELLNLGKAKKLADTFDEKEGKIFMNLVFRDRVLHFLEKEGLNGRGPTAEIRRIIKLFKTWKPTGRRGLDILCKLLGDSQGDDGPCFANNNNIFLDIPLSPDQQCLTPGIRKHFLQSDPVWLFSSKDSEYHVVVARNGLPKN